MHRFTGKTEQMAQKAAERINRHNAAIDYHTDGGSVYFLFYFGFDGSGKGNQKP